MAEGRCSVADCGGSAVYAGTCVGHMSMRELVEYVGQLGPDATLDARGAPIDEQHCLQLIDLLAAVPLSDADFSGAQFTGANFSGAQFNVAISFGGAQFSGTAYFDRAQFNGDANFNRTQFNNYASFGGAQFNGFDTRFLSAQFTSTASFRGARFTGRTDFRQAQFTSDADFAGAHFTSSPEFTGAQFGGDAGFRGTQFNGDFASFAGALFNGNSAIFGEVLFAGDANFTKAQFSSVAFFGRAQFTGRAEFRSGKFTGTADFRRGQFTGDAIFNGAHVTGNADFRDARFGGDADFRDAQLSSDADFRTHIDFRGAQFTREADFGQTQFSRDADFSEAQFSRTALFVGAQFSDAARFHAAEFSDGADLGGTQFGESADFGLAQFNGTASFSEAQVNGTANFMSTQFSRLCLLGPLRADTLDLTAAAFEGPAVIHGACSTISADEIRALDSFTMTGRGCDITMTRARFEAPARIGSSTAGVNYPPPVAQDDNKPPRLLSVEGTDLSNVTLAGLNLAACLFVGAHNLDELHIDGPPDFAETPAGWRWARRRTLAEEHIWRASYDRRPAGWYPLRCRPRNHELPVHDREGSRTAAAGAEAARVQAAYRELRKSFEDARNEPGAADFYYGEMEMRRMASRAAPPHRFEYALLTAYWAVSGCGLRASRALLTLLLVLAVATVLFATVGFGRTQQTVFEPIHSTTANQKVAYKQISVPNGKPGLRDAAYYSIQSATSLLREPITRPLTTSGRITEITLRLLGPLLLGLAVLAVRGRVKR